MAQPQDRTDGGWNAVAIDTSDNVAVALAELVGSASVHSGGRHFNISLIEPIPMGHKFAIRPIAQGTAVLKYGQAIGSAAVDIPVGAHVHVTNVVSNRARINRDEGTA